MTEADALLAALCGDITEFNDALRESAELYRDPAQQDHVITEQLFIVLRLVERLIKPPATLFPLWDHLHKLIERQASRHGRGQDPVNVPDMMRRACALTLMEFLFEASWRKDVTGAAKTAAAAYPGFAAGQLINWRKRANNGSDRVLQKVRDGLLKDWRARYPGDPLKAAEEVKKIALQAKKVYAGPSK